MSDAIRKRLLEIYLEQAMPTPGFFSGMFLVRPGNVYSGEKVEIDIVRGGQQVAIAMRDMKDGYHWNTDDLYVNKEFMPPAYKEGFTVNAFELIKRQAGQNPFEDANFRGILVTKIFRGVGKVTAKIDRAIEFQAARVLQTGKMILPDLEGNPQIEIDFKPKASHFITAGTAWDVAGSDPEADIAAACDVIRNDGKQRADQIIFGTAAFAAALRNEKFRQLFNDDYRIERGRISGVPNRGEESAQYRGVIDIGQSQLDVWTYDATYEDVDGSTEHFLDPANVVVRSSRGRLDATYGAVPNIAKLLGMDVANQVSIPELPGRLTSAEHGIDLHINTWLSTNGEDFYAGVGTRPLMIPTAIDTFACISTGV